MRKKFLVALLALILVVLAIPAHAAESVSAPAKLPNESEFVLTSVTDGTMTNSGNNVTVSKFASQFDNTTKTIFDSVSVIDATKCDGMLLRVDSTLAKTQWRFIIVTDENGTQYEVKKKAFYWWNGSAWSNGSLADNCSGASASGYVYVKFSELDLPVNTIYNLKLYSTKSTTRAGVFSEWSIVQTKEQAKAYPLVAKETIPAPTVLPDGTTQILLKSVTDGTLTKADGVSAGAYSLALENKTYSIFENGTQDLANYKGFMVKAKATGSAKLYLRFKLKMADGSEVEIKSANRPLAWYDGTNWTQLAGAASNWQTPVAEGYAFLAFPLDEFEANGTEVADIQVYSSNGTSRMGEFSDWCLVYTEDQLITGKNVTLTDDLALNVYANIPDGCTDATVKFEIGGKETVATLEDGRYSLKNLLPQQMGEEITATWTGTVDGNTVTETFTLTMADYCKEILADSTLSEWHELTKALLHYGAAAQAKVGMTDGLCNKDVAEVTNKVVLSDIASVKNNNAPDVWQGATLRLDNSFALKIRLTAPASVTSVTATVDGAAAKALDIVDGYVTLSLGASELSKKIVFSYGDAEKTLEITADHVLKNTVDPSFIDLAQAIANYANAAAAVAQ